MKALNREEVLVNAKANGTLDSFKPLTRDEAFMKKALGLGGGSGGDVLIVTATTDMETGVATLSSSYEEVIEAFNSEKAVILCDKIAMGELAAIRGYSAMCSKDNDGVLWFAMLQSDHNSIWTIGLNSDNTLTRNNYFGINYATITNASGLMMQSSTNNSEKMFRILVYDDGQLKVEEA